MCTVTYIPQAGDNFILTSNRDESAVRSPQNLTQDQVNGINLIFPRDTAAGGTWIAASEDGKVVCLLNGAFAKHSHRPPYRRSRGLMVLDYFSFSSPDSFAKYYQFSGMEPFTFILAGKGRLYELRWDEKKVHFQSLDVQQNHIWSSSTLYPPEIQNKRLEWFDHWQTGRSDFSLQAIQDFHHHGGEPDPWNGFIMNRKNIVQTVSVTNVIRGKEKTKMIYNDIIRGKIKEKEIELKTLQKQQIS